ncbi:hypothetical protein J3U42_09800 [Gilliamella sp. B2923]|uniref:hypothetical protein n=1 Tax=Gilliamella sp. B2923 TaxID=2818005 RepID=UPI00226AD82B|nr:hypothetical protein [Gilliamella sp. B2923]MCX8618688.1 hypothetical protein [Gilliamella sp. B2923]
MSLGFPSIPKLTFVVLVNPFISFFFMQKLYNLNKINMLYNEKCSWFPFLFLDLVAELARQDDKTPSKNPQYVLKDATTKSNDK